MLQSILGYISTELENCLSSGPTSFKSLGILFILSENKVKKATSLDRGTVATLTTKSVDPP